MPVTEEVYKLCVAKPKAFNDALYDQVNKFLQRHVQHLRKVCVCVCACVCKRERERERERESLEGGIDRERECVCVCVGVGAGVLEACAVPPVACILLVV